MLTAPIDAVTDDRFRRPATISPQARLTNRLGRCRERPDHDGGVQRASLLRAAGAAVQVRYDPGNEAGPDALAEVACRVVWSGGVASTGSRSDIRRPPACGGR